MPSAHIEFEQHSGDRWAGEVEAGGQPGGPPFKRSVVAAHSFAAMMDAVAERYYEQVPGDRPVAPQAKPVVACSSASRAVADIPVLPAVVLPRRGPHGQR